MNNHKKMIFISIACVMCVSMAAMYLLKSAPSQPEPPLIVADESAEDDERIISDAPVIPAPITPPSEPAIITDPLPEPEQIEEESSVSFTEPVEKPAEANTEIHEKGEENEPPDPPPSNLQPVAPVPQQPNEPKGGETNSKGQVYVPGFGWLTPSGPNRGEVTGSDGDINKQVGEM